MSDEFTDAKWLQNKFNRAIGPQLCEWATKAAEMAGATDVQAELFDLARVLGVALVRDGKKLVYREPVSPTAIQDLHEWVLNQ